MLRQMGHTAASGTKGLPASCSVICSAFCTVSLNGRFLYRTIARAVLEDATVIVIAPSELPRVVPVSVGRHVGSSIWPAELIGHQPPLLYNPLDGKCRGPADTRTRTSTLGDVVRYARICTQPRAWLGVAACTADTRTVSWMGWIRTVPCQYSYENPGNMW